MPIPHNHALDGRLHEGCPSCALIKRLKKRDRAHVEVQHDLDRIYQKAQQRYQARKNKR